MAADDIQPSTKGAETMSAQGHTATTGSAEQEIRQTDRMVAELIVSRDVPTLGPLVDDRYTHVSPMGDILSKAEMAGAIESDAISVSRYETDDVNVRVYGDAAVLTGRATLKGTLKGADI